MNFSKSIEKLVDPINVGSLHFIQGFNKYLPRKIQDYFVKSSSKTTPFMGFVVEPYATFLCYEIKDLETAKSFLPDGFELMKTKIFEDDVPKYYVIFGCFTAHTSAFWGSRSEFYVIARDIKTDMLSWIIVDYDSNTISYDKKDGLRSPNSSAVVTTNYTGTVFVDIKKNDKSRELVFNADTTAGVFKRLDQRLWLEGNLSIGYGSSFDRHDADIFSLRFEPGEVEKGLEIPLEKTHIQTNSWFQGLFGDTPQKVVCFPYAQHFLSDSPGSGSNLRNKEELVKAVEGVNFDKLKVFSTESFRIMIVVGTVFSFLLTALLVILLVIK